MEAILMEATVHDNKASEEFELWHENEEYLESFQIDILPKSCIFFLIPV